MKKIHYQIDVQAPVKKVVERMLSKDTYKLWAAEFNPTSDFEGGWNTGDKIYFTACDEAGKKSGMVAKVVEHTPNKLVSLRHYGILEDGVEITEGPAVEGWAGAMENYYYEEQDGVTNVRIECETHDDYIDYFDTAWPKALQKLKEIAEKE